ncbi:MAG: tRNA 2-thiouridine(34) synthase MnmA [Chloroflexota bacterium]
MARKVVVAMSGGVDSSVAAALLLEQGFDVVGVTLNVWPKVVPGSAERENACCSLSAVEDARRVADQLGIAHYTLNFRDIFAGTVIEDFVSEYAAGRTPNPCIRCNEHVKFDALLRRALALDADYLATGHYARVAYDATRGRYLLRRGADSAKDQAYVLYTLTQAQLAHALFPLGGLTKAETRARASALGLTVALKAESQEICFVPDNDYGAFLRDYAGLRPQSGPIVDRSGTVLGQHRGLAYYTVGQRRGLGLSGGEPYYVVALDPADNRLIVGREHELYACRLVADRVNFIAVAELSGPTAVQAKVRYRAAEAAAVAEMAGPDALSVTFTGPQRAPAPGQAVVLYQGDLVLGGGTIRGVEL